MNMVGAVGFAVGEVAGNYCGCLVCLALWFSYV